MATPRLPVWKGSAPKGSNPHNPAKKDQKKFRKTAEIDRPVTTYGYTHGRQVIVGQRLQIGCGVSEEAE